jgi:2-methylisocitrate lyase-like PEP mutase family enzyme
MSNDCCVPLMVDLDDGVGGRIVTYARVAEEHCIKCSL